VGLVNYVVPSAHLEQKLSEILSKLRGLSAVALEMTRRALDSTKARSIETALKEVENMYLHELMKSEDANEGIKAFMEKRKPVWRNR